MNIFDIAGRAMGAGLVRLNTSASNLANAGATARTEAEAYRPMKPVFQTVYDGESGRATVDTLSVVQTDAKPERRYAPGHPLADPEGYVYVSSVDTNAELVDMVETSRQYSNNLQVLETAKSLILDTLRLGQ